VGLIIYPSEDFAFVNLVELPDLILDLFCIHLKIYWLLWIWLQYTIDHFYQYFSSCLGHPALELSLARLI
jgi:hypothetical protein